MSINEKYLIVGAGFSGAVLARKLVEKLDVQIDVVDQRDHVAGNCHTSRDETTGVMVHRYGPHIFNTSRKDVWDFVREYGDFVPYVNRVKAVLSSGIYSMPLNLHTINQFFGLKLSPDQAKEFINSKADVSISDPQNLEEQALKMMGTDLYKAFFYGYTKKQWGCEPSELPASILKRLPMRFDYNDNYYHAEYQAIPREGYSEVVVKMLDHPKVNVTTGVHFNRAESLDYAHVFYTGPIDGYFDFSLGRLGYRTVTFKEFKGKGDHLGNAVLNYPEMDVPYTRIHEHKHFAPWENHDETIWFEEYSKETESNDVPFYPKRLANDLTLLSEYQKLAKLQKSTSFLGRLATYRYLNMDHAIGEAMDFAEDVIIAIENNHPIPIFPEGVV